MSNEVLIALIGFASAVVGAVFGYLGNNRKQAVLTAQREQAQQDTLNDLKKEMAAVTKRLDAHNGYAEKFARTSESIAILATNQKNIKDDVESIKKTVEYLKSDRCKV